MKRIFFFLCFFVSSACVAQVVNGSFENFSSPDLSAWAWTCGAESINSAPPAGGNWCIKVAGGNVKGCYPGYAYQKIPSITNGQTFTLSGWAFSETPRLVGIYFGTINKGIITTQAGDTTTSTLWKQLSVQSSFSLSQGDTAVVVLFGGIAAGPVQGYGYFDLINLEEVTGIYQPEQKQSLTVTPNPFSEETLVQFGKTVSDASLLVYNVHGQLLSRTNHISGQSYSFHRGHLPTGVYFFQVVQDNKVIGLSKMDIRDF